MADLEVPTNEVELVDKKKVVAELLRLGTDTETISTALKVSKGYVQSVERNISQTTIYLTPQDQEIANMMRDLAHRAYGQAVVILEFGSPAEKNSLIRAIIGRSMALIGVERSSAIDNLRNEFQQLLGGGRAPDDDDEDEKPWDYDG